MGLGALVDAAAGVLAVMVLFSLAATAIQEAVAQLFNTRGRVLRDGIVALLKATKPAGLDVGQAKALFYGKFYTEAKLDGLTHEPVSWVSRTLQRIGLLLQGVEKPIPSAIPPRRYAEALVKLADRDARDAAARQAQTVIEKAEQELGGLYARLAAAGGPQAAQDAAEDVAGAAAAARRFVADAQTVIEARIAHHEREFNEAMDRAKGWYARRVRTTLFAIGLVLAGGANIDILSYGERLLTEEAFRVRSAAHADLFGQRLKAAESGQSTAPLLADALGLQDVEALAAELSGLGVQVGWCDTPITEPTSPSTTSSTAGMIAPDPSGSMLAICPAGETVRSPSFRAIVGWFIIAFGVTLGAQFWYDLFRKALDLRSSGRVTPPES